MYAEEDLRPISALQHLAFCERQCALIHLDQIWEENRLTAEGRILHERVHERGSESRVERIIVRGLAIRSLEFGLVGVADAVEFLRCRDPDTAAVCLPDTFGRWRPFPVEYKRGRPKRGRYDEIQLCAQALCLEEMLETVIPSGALYYGKTRRRAAVSFDENLRGTTRDFARQLHHLLSSARLPAADPGPKCKRCSLKTDCLPTVSGSSSSRRSARSYVDATLREMSSAANGAVVPSDSTPSSNDAGPDFP
jgi:CRISPR-associated exonuclease Cas4